MRPVDRQLWERVKRRVAPARLGERTPVVTPHKARAVDMLAGREAAPVPAARPGPGRAPGAGVRSATAPLPLPAGEEPADRRTLDAFEAWWRATEPRSAPAAPRAPSGSPSAPSPAAAPRSAPSPGPLDRPTVRRIAKRRVAIDGRIDLHGLTEAEAHGRLLGYLERAREAGLRHVIVVTGKGRGGHRENGVERRGVLRRAVPRWFQTPPFARLVSGHHAAAPGDGGDGALYVKLRRARPG